MGCLWQRAIGLCSGFGEVAADAFDAASMLLCKLCGGLLAVAVKLPEGIRLKSAAAAETLVASSAFVALFAITGTVLLNLFGAAKKAFFVFKGFQLPKALQRKGCGDF